MCDKTRYDELAKQVKESSSNAFNAAASAEAAWTEIKAVKAILLKQAPIDEALSDIYKGSARMAKIIVRTAQVFMALTIIGGSLYAAFHWVVHWRPN